MTGIGQLVVVFLPRDREWIWERRNKDFNCLVM